MSLDVVLVGFGYAGRTFHAPLILAEPGLRLRSVVSSRPDAVAAALGPRMPVHASLSAALAEGPALVVIATPNDSHAPLAMQALQAGCDVVVDKPFTLSLAEAEDLAALAEAEGRRISVFHNRRWDSDFLTLRALLDSGRLGRITHVESHFDRFRPLVLPRWREADGPGAGLWWDLGPHLLDQALQLFGQPDGLQLDRTIQRDGAAACDWWHAVLRYGEMRVVLHASALAAAPTPRWIVHGTRGSFVCHGLDVQEAQLKAGKTPGCPGWGVAEAPAQLILAPEGEPVLEPLPLLPGDYRPFYGQLAAGGDPVPLQGALAVMALLDR